MKYSEFKVEVEKLGFFVDMDAAPLYDDKTKGGSVPDGYVVSFKDGDKLNCVIDNLFLVSRGAFTSVAKRGLRNEHPEINYSTHLLAELELAIKRKEGKL